jgi:hypothetical protein
MIRYDNKDKKVNEEILEDDISKPKQIILDGDKQAKITKRLLYNLENIKLKNGENIVQGTTPTQIKFKATEDDLSKLVGSPTSYDQFLRDLYSMNIDTYVHDEFGDVIVIQEYPYYFNKVSGSSVNYEFIK